MNNIFNAIIKLSSVIFLLFLLTLGIFAQTPTTEPVPSPTPSDRERQLEEEKRIKTLQKDIAEAEQAIRDAQPKPSTTPLAGDAELKDVKIESDMVTYKAVSDSLGKIAGVIKDKALDAGMIILYSPQDMANLDAYDSNKQDVESQILNLQERYKEIKKSYCSQLGCPSQVGEYNLEYNIKKIFPNDNTAFNDINRVDFNWNFPDKRKFSENSSSKSNNRVELLSQGLANQSSANNALSNSSNILTPISTVTAALGLATDLLAVFRTDTNISGQKVDVGESAMVAEISRVFNDRQLPVYYPQKYFPLTDGTNALNSNIYTRITVLNTEKKNAEQTIFKYQFYVDAAITNQTAEKTLLQNKIGGIDKYIAELVTARAAAKTLKEKKAIQAAITENENSKTPIETQIKEIDRNLFILNAGKFHMDKLREINTDARSFINSLVASSDGKPSKMLSFLRAEKMRSIQADATNKGKRFYWLEMEAVSAGGNNRTRKNLILYFTGAKIDHSGGAIISWKLYNPDGSIKYSGIDQQYDGYKSAKTIRKQQQQKPSGNQTTGNVNNKVGGSN